MDDDNLQNQQQSGDSQAYSQQNPSAQSGQPVIGGKPPKKTMPFLIGVIVVGVLIIGIFLFAALSGGDSGPNAPDAPSPSDPISPNGPQPAQPLDVEQSSNAISEDLGSLNDDVDLPRDQLSDDNLDL